MLSLGKIFLLWSYLQINRTFEKVVNSNWVFRIKRWKKMSSEEKMNRLWLLFRLMIIVMIVNMVFELYKNYVLLSNIGSLTGII